MKRYWLFGCRQYYPNGGLDDLRGTFDKYEDCLYYIDTQFNEIDRDDIWFSIFDSKEQCVYTIEDGAIFSKAVYENGLFVVKGR